MSLPKEMLELLKVHANKEHTYINPYFLVGITNLLEEYYALEDREVDKWVKNMWSC